MVQYTLEHEEYNIQQNPRTRVPNVTTGGNWGSQFYLRGTGFVMAKTRLDKPQSPDVAFRDFGFCIQGLGFGV